MPRNIIRAGIGVLLVLLGVPSQLGPGIVRGAGSEFDQPAEPRRGVYPAGDGPQADGYVVSVERSSLGAAASTTDERTASLGWHQEAHDAQHTGFIDQQVTAPWKMAWQWNGSCSDGRDCRPGDPEQGWTFEIPSKSHLVAGGGRLYLPAGSRGVWAINGGNGKTAWHNSSIHSYCTAAFDPDTNALFVAASSGKLYKLNASNGSTLDMFEAGSGLNLAPTIAAGRVYVVSDNGTLYAVDKSTMNLAWSYASGTPGQTPAAYSAGYDLLVFGTEDLYVHAVKNANGSLRWREKSTPNLPGNPSYDGGDGRMYRKYNYEHGWPVIAEGHDVVLIRLHQPNPSFFSVPGSSSGPWYPSSNSAIRSYLTGSPHLQTLFALKLTDGSPAFIPAVGPGGIDTPDLDTGSTLGPPPVVRVLSNGEEVVYTIWRNGQKCEAGDCSDPRWDAVMGEMVLDGSTVPGYQAGDLRFVHFGREGHAGSDLITDEMGKLSMAGDTLFHSHWLALHSYRITDRSDALGSTYGSPIRTERQPFVVNRASDEPGWVTCEPDSSHHCDGYVDTHCDSRAFEEPFWVFFNYNDPPYSSCGGYGDGYAARYAIVDNGAIYYELNGGAIFALKSASETLVAVDKQVWPSFGSRGDSVTHTVNIIGNGNRLTLTDSVPSGVSAPDGLHASSGTVGYDSGRRLVTWVGEPQVGEPVTIRYAVEIQVDGPLALISTLSLSDSEGYVFSDQTAMIADPIQSFLPLSRR